MSVTRGLYPDRMRLRGKAFIGLGLAASVLALYSVSSGSESADAATSTGMPTGNVVSNGRTWVPVVSRSFNTPAPLGTFVSTYGAEFSGYSGFGDTSNKGVYDPNRVLSAHDGYLDIYLRTASGKPRVAAPMPNGYKPQTYGRYAVRFRTDTLPGYKLAFLLWPTSNNWNEGEVDWPDGVAAGKTYAASAIRGSMQYGQMSFEGPPHSAAPTMGTGWHVAVTEWTAGHVRWYMDGKLIGQTSNTAGVPNTPMRWTLQTETNVDSTPVSSSVHGHIDVDWVVQYK
jgi:beta-glucanase (GH16 family)